MHGIKNADFTAQETCLRNWLNFQIRRAKTAEKPSETSNLGINIKSVFHSSAPWNS